MVHEVNSSLLCYNTIRGHRHIASLIGLFEKVLTKCERGLKLVQLSHA